MGYISTTFSKPDPLQSSMANANISTGENHESVDLESSVRQPLRAVGLFSCPNGLTTVTNRQQKVEKVFDPAVNSNLTSCYTVAAVVNKTLALRRFSAGVSWSCISNREHKSRGRQKNEPGRSCERSIGRIECTVVLFL